MENFSLSVGNKIVAYVVKDPLASVIEKVNATVVRASYFLGGVLDKGTTAIEYRLPHKVHAQVATGLGCEFMLTELEAREYIKRRLASKIEMVELELRRLEYFNRIDAFIADSTVKKRSKA
jgi:hypothetical protein